MVFIQIHTICFFFDFDFFHYSWFAVFCQFSTAQHGDPVTHTCIHLEYNVGISSHEEK